MVHDIPVAPNAVPNCSKLSSHQYLQNKRFPTINQQSVQLLIGANVPQVFRVQEVQSAPNVNLPDAVRTPLGWS